jgi:hypothetical protein
MWYKESQSNFNYDETFAIKNFADRNLVNEKIRSLQDIANMLRYCSELVYQTQRGARSVVSEIRKGKKMSSYPSILLILDQADAIALDSPSKFSELCVRASFEIDNRAKKLIRLREDFAYKNDNKDKIKKGLF